MENEHEEQDIFCALKILCWIGKFFGSMSFSVVGNQNNRKIIVKSIDLVLRIFYCLFYCILWYVYYLDHMKGLDFDFDSFILLSPGFIQILLMLVLLIFGTCFWKRNSNILFILQNLCSILETKNIFVNYKRIKIRCCATILAEVIIFSLYISSNFLDILKNISSLLLMYCIFSAVSLEIQLIVFLDIIKRLTLQFNKHFKSLLGLKIEIIEMILKDITDIQYEIFMACKYLNNIYHVIIIRIITTWHLLVLCAYIYTTPLIEETIHLFIFNAILWNGSNFYRIIKIIYLYEACKKEVCKDFIYWKFEFINVSVMS